jgi:outer membrane protease
VLNLLKRGLPVLLALFVLPVVPLMSEEAPVSGSFHLNTGVFFGGMTEYVFEKGREQELSRLEWEENFVPYIEAIGEVTFKNFFFDLSVLSAIPAKSGAMRDSDYMLAGSDEQSHFSKHDAWFDKHLEAFFSIGYAFHVGNWTLSPAAGFMYRVRKWTAEDGYVQYPTPGRPWSEQTPKENTRGVIISYEEEMWFPIVSLGAAYQINKNWGSALCASWYPYLNVETIDSHFLRKTVFYDSMKGGNGVYAELALLYYPRAAEALNFKFAVGFEGIYPPKGTSRIAAIGYDSGVTESAQTQPTLESNLFWVSLGVVFYPGKIWK